MIYNIKKSLIIFCKEIFYRLFLKKISKHIFKKNIFPKNTLNRITTKLNFNISNCEIIPYFQA